MGGRWIVAAVAISTLVAVVALYLAVDNIARAGPGSAPAASPDVPTVISYQGLVTDPGTGDPVADGNYNMRFRIYDAAAAGTLLWQEPAPADPAAAVPVAGGVFTVLLGSVVPLGPAIFADGDAYLEVEVNGETLAPRQRIAAVAYALVAQTLTVPATLQAPITVLDDGTTGYDLMVSRQDIGQTVGIDSSRGFIDLGGSGEDGDIWIRDTTEEVSIQLDGQLGHITLGAPGEDGDLWVRDAADATTINLDGASGDVSQSRTGDGLAKAAVSVNADASVDRWFNNVNNQVPTVTKVAEGVYDVDFKFKVDDRYLAISVLSGWFLAPYGQTHISYWYQSDNVVRIFTQQSDDNTPVPFVDEPVDWVFQVIIY